MDFFEAQERARRRSKRLVFLFILAVLGTILATYAIAIFSLNQRELLDDSVHLRNSYYGETRPAASWRQWWNPEIFLWTAGTTLAVVGIASLYKWNQLRSGGAAVAEMVGGRRVDLQTTDFRERQLLNVVEEIAIASGIPVPAVFVLDEETALNAFAAGLNTSDAAVAVTRGTLEKLTRDELQGVIAHEFSHILNGDMRLNVRITAVVFGILVIGLLGRALLQSVGRGRVRVGGKKDNSFAILLGLGLILMVLGYIGYFFGRLIQAAVSRQREFLADASAVQFTRNPLGIGGALKKIGGYALGGRILNSHAAEFGHFFFAQAFKSNFGGLWATHPPLDQRIRAVEPSWDGKLFEPAQTVDVAQESFRTAGHRPRPAPSVAAARSGPPPIPSALASAIPPIAFVPAAVVATIGSLTETHFSEAQKLLETIPPALREASRDPAQVPALVYALVLGAAALPAEKITQLLQTHADAATAHRVADLLPLLRTLPAATRLPLLQLCLPSLRQLDAPGRDQFATVLDELVHADAQVTPFEFALHKMLLHQLQQSGPQKVTADFHSFHAVAASVGVVLSLVSRVGQRDESTSLNAFQAGASQLPLLAPQLHLLSPTESSLEIFSDALDRLARASLPIKQRTLIAVAQAISADGQITAEEGDLYRAIAATLDCPVPVFGATT